MKIYKGRYTAHSDKTLLVFLVGMRVNHLWAIHRWLPVLIAMPRMLKDLRKNKEKGLLHSETLINFRGFVSLQYWQSFDHLMDFARSPEELHLGDWRNYNLKIGESASVGIWHETYVIPAGNSEAIYGNMPRFGLAAASEHKSINPATESADRRLKNPGQRT